MGGNYTVLGRTGDGPDRGRVSFGAKEKFINVAMVIVTQFHEYL